MFSIEIMALHHAVQMLRAAGADYLAEILEKSLGGPGETKGSAT